MVHWNVFVIFCHACASSLRSPFASWCLEIWKSERFERFEDSKTKTQHEREIKINQICNDHEHASAPSIMKKKKVTVETRGFEEVCLCRGRLVGCYLKGDRLLINHHVAERTSRHKTLKPYGTSAGVLKSNLLRFAPKKKWLYPQEITVASQGTQGLRKRSPSWSLPWNAVEAGNRERTWFDAI